MKLLQRLIANIHFAGCTLVKINTRTEADNHIVLTAAALLHLATISAPIAHHLAAAMVTRTHLQDLRHEFEAALLLPSAADRGHHRYIVEETMVGSEQELGHHYR